VPVSAEALGRAIELNGTGVRMNQAAFLWGRRAAVDLKAVEKLVAPKVEQAASTSVSGSLDDTIARRIAFLTDYQDAAWAGRYRRLVDEVRVAEAAKTQGGSALTEAVARYFFKLMAYKDEYEVARLYTTGEFRRKVDQQFEGDIKLRFHLAPPLFSRRDPVSGELQKREYGAWVFSAFRLLTKLKGLRGTALDVFGHTKERKAERALIGEYETTIRAVLASLDNDNHEIAVQIASIPEEIRGFGHVKERHLEAAKAKEAQLVAAFGVPVQRRAAA
jgi:indolepyruvate ferredoxin oxidoreductase